MAEEKKTSKKTSKEADVKVVFDKDEHHKDDECPLLEEVVARTKRRIDNLEEMINDEMNPLHRVELEAKRKENVNLLCFIRSLGRSGPEAKLLKAIFGE